MNDTINNTWLKRASTFLFLFFLFSVSLSAQLPNGFTDVKIQSGYTSPMGVIFSTDGQKMFIWEKAGLVWCSIWNGTTYVKQATPTLDISDEVGNWGDFGLESLALDPNFDRNGLIYLFYQVDRHHLFNFGTPQYNSTANEYYQATISRLTRYKTTTINNSLTIDKTSRKVLLGETKSTGVPATYQSHAGGQIIFGADGTLIVSTGDNASFDSSDMGSASETYYQQAIDDGIMRPTENVGAFRSQLINSFCGKLLRLDPITGDAIPSNPYYDAADPRSAKSRTWALGLRNPYRMTFKTGTGSTNPADANPGTLIVGDVQNGTWEEFHVLEMGGLNCGWPLYEGITPQYQFYDSGIVNPEESGSPTFASLCVLGGKNNINNPIPSQRRYVHSAPALDWQHGVNNTRYVDYTKGSIGEAVTIGSAGATVPGTPFEGDCVTAGTYYTGTAFPANYRNVFFFGDYSSNWIKAASLHDNSDHQLHEVLDFAPAGYCNGLVDIELCPLDESIFYVNINSGDIQRISYGLTNRPPVAVITSDKVSGVSPLVVNLNSNNSYDPDGNPITYNWDFGDGSPHSTAANVAHTFSSAGSKGFIVTLRVSDDQGLADTKTLVISTNNTPPSVKITNPVNNSLYSVLDATLVNLQSSVTDNDITGMQYAWQVTLRHNTHEHREPVNNQQSPTVPISPVGCGTETFYYAIELTVTDNGGLMAKDSVKIYPDCSTQNLSVQNLTATAQTNAVAVNWTFPPLPFDEIMVVAREGVGFTASPLGTNYIGNTSFTGGGSSFEGGKVIYRGIGTHTTITELTANTRYFFRVFTRRGGTWTGGVETSAIPTPPTITPELGCLTASYFNNINLKGTPLVIRGESSINNEYIYGGPTAAGIGVDSFSVRWEGTVIPPVEGSYTFTVTSDDGVRLWVNNVLVINKWFDQPATVYTATVNLTQGQNVPIKLEYYEGDGRAFAKLFWTIPNQESQVVAFKACSGTTVTTQLGCLTASYFNNTTLSGTPTAVRGESNINNDWVYGGPTVTGIGVDNFSVRWDGTVIPPVTGTYTFNVTSDDGVRLWVNNVLVIDKWLDQSATIYTATVNLTKSQNVAIKMEYYEGDGRASAKLFWTIPSQVSQVVAFTPCSLPTSTSGFDPNKCYVITGRQSGKVIEIPGSSLTTGTNIQQRTYLGGAKNQLWKLKSNGDGTYRIVNGNSGKVVDILGAVTTKGGYAVQMDWNTNNNQRFTFDKSTDGSYKIIAKHSGLPLEVQYSSQTDGALIWQYTASGSYAQLFKVDEAVCPVGIVALESANILAANGYRNGKKAVITWISNANESSDYFMVQKFNPNQLIFEKVETVSVTQGNATDKNFYSVEDLQPTDGENIYRVVLYRKNVVLPQYSDIVSLDFSYLNDFMLFPNPSDDYVDIDLETARYRSVNITLTDATGKILRQQKIASAPIAPVRMSLEGLSIGQYFVRIEAEGKREVVKKLVIVR